MATAPKTHRPLGGTTARQQYDKRRGSAVERGYDHRWHECREWYVRRNGLCEDCAVKGLTVIVDEVDHIIPFKGSSDRLRLDHANLRSRCKACHTRKTRQFDVWIRRLWDNLMSNGTDYYTARDMLIEKVLVEKDG